MDVLVKQLYTCSYPGTVRMDRLGIESGLSTEATQYLNDVGIHLRTMDG